MGDTTLKTEERPPPVKKLKTEDFLQEQETGNAYIHAKIEWSKLPDVSAKMESFRLEKVHPHIIEEEKKSAIFLKFLDYLRVGNIRYPTSLRVEGASEGINESVDKREVDAPITGKSIGTG